MDAVATERPLVLFHHCPKTAGSSFHKFLEDAYGPEHVLQVTNLLRMTRQDFADKLARWDVRCVTGHIPPSLAPPGVTFRLSFVRQPDDLAVSHVCYSLTRRHAERRYREFFAQRLSRGRLGLDDVLAYHRRFGTDNPQTRFFASVCGEPVTEVHLACALRAIDALDFVGVFERLPQAVDTIRRMLRIGERHFWHMNRSDRSLLRLTEAEKRVLVRELMPLDLALYRHAHARALRLEHMMADTPLPGGGTVMMEDERRDKIRSKFLRWKRRDLPEWRWVAARDAQRVVALLEDWRRPLPAVPSLAADSKGPAD